MPVVATLGAALASLTPALAAVGLPVAQVTGALATAASAATAAGPIAPAVIAATYLATAWKKIKRSLKNIEACRDRAGLWVVRQPGLVVRVADIPTPEWAECWHKGLQTSDRVAGRISRRVPGAVVRQDVLPQARGGDQVLAWAVLGRALATGELLVVPWLGPWGLSRGGLRQLDLVGYSPSAYADSIALASILYARKDLPAADRAIASRVALAAARFAAGKPVLGWNDAWPRTPQAIDQARRLAELAAALATGTA